MKMQSPETGRAEWNARDFGTAAHEVLERWGRDTEARNLDKPETIHDWLSAELDRVVGEWFGKRVPLAVRIQTESLRQRLLWLSRVQAATCQDGWEMVDVERKVELPVGRRADRRENRPHRPPPRDGPAAGARLQDRQGRWRGQGAPQETQRLQRASGASQPRNVRPCYEGEDKGKSAEFLWTNLQLPLYAAALVARGEPLPAPCYFTLRSTEADVAMLEWSDFESADLEAAQHCADWVAGQIAAGVFWPPAEKVTYDDFAVLAAGRELGEMIEFRPDPVRAE